MGKHAIKLNSIKCNNPSESHEPSGDEVYLVLQADGGIPIHVPGGLNPSHNMSAGQTWNLNDGDGITLYFEWEALVTIWDHDINDDPNSATYLQSHDFRPGTGESPIALTNPNGASYEINYENIS